MKNLKIHNANFITYVDDPWTMDILGGIDLTGIERMFCTLRITYQEYPPHRTTLDLYNDRQVDGLLRTLCDKWEVKLLDISRSLHQLIAQLESYRLDRLKYNDQPYSPAFQPREEDRKQAIKTLGSPSLKQQVIQMLNTTGIIGEDDNALILYLALCSHKYHNPFSVLCLARSGMGKSYILQKLAECMPEDTYSFHTQISPNALYYFRSEDIQNKALLVEDLEWTTQMLTPLSTLQTQGKLIKTRATKDKDGMLHSTTFEVEGNLCLLACAYSDKNYESLSLPFLMVHLNHSHEQDLAIMEYQKKCKAGQIRTEEIHRAQYALKCLIATLQNVSIINPYAPLIDLPEDIAHPRKSLLLLLNFVEVVTYFFQHQRTHLTEPETGEVHVLTHPDDVALAFQLLKNSLFRRADELSAATRGFYHWLTDYLKHARTSQFTALDIRLARSVHPRTLNRYLHELKLYSYIKVIGGNRHREGYRYKLTDLGDHDDVQKRIEQALQSTLIKVRAQYDKDSREAA